MRWHEGHDGWGAGGWIVMSFMMLLFWAVVIGGFVWAIRSGGLHPRDPSANRARQILDERFARGEIDADEYKSRRDQLTGQ